MNAVSLGGVARVAPPGVASARAMGAAPSLLPAAEKPSLPQMQDAMARLYMVISQLREQQANQGKTDVQCAKAARDVAAQEEKAALERAKKAAEEGGFFDWVANDIGLAGVVGLVTFDYPLVAADIAAHELGVFDRLDEKVDLVDVAAVATGRWEVVAADVILRKTDLAPDAVRGLVERSGVPKDAPGVSKKDVDPIAKDVLLVNLFVLSTAATVLSCGTTGAVTVALLGIAISLGGQKIAEENALDPLLGEGASRWVGAGMQIYGTAATCMSGFAGGAAFLPATGVRGAAIVNGATSAMKGSDQIVTAVHEHERDEANIDAAEARHELTRLERLIERLTDAIKEMNRSHQKAAETLQGAIDTANQTDLSLSRAIKG